MEKYRKIKDNENYYRDLKTNAVVNFDYNAYDSYVNNYKRKLQDIKTINELSNEVSSLKEDINEIKNLLRNIVNGSK